MFTLRNYLLKSKTKIRQTREIVALFTVMPCALRTTFEILSKSVFTVFLKDRYLAQSFNLAVGCMFVFWRGKLKGHVFPHLVFPGRVVLGLSE